MRRGYGIRIRNGCFFTLENRHLSITLRRGVAFVLGQQCTSSRGEQNSTMFSRASMSEKSMSNFGTHGETLSVYLEASLFLALKGIVFANPLRYGDKSSSCFNSILSLAPIGPGDRTILAENGDICTSYTQLSGKFRNSYARPSYSQFQMATQSGSRQQIIFSCSA
jgi:hypothetical protein